jgi:hypothetical protein
VAREIVPYDDVAWRELRHEAFFHPFLEHGGVHRLVESLLRHETGQAQTGDERDRLVVTVRNGGAQPATAPASPAFTGQVRRRPGLVDEYEFRRIEIELPGKPVPTPLQNVRALLFLGVRRLFLKVIP